MQNPVGSTCSKYSQTHRLSLYKYREVKTDYIFGVILGPNLMRIEKSSPGVRDEGVVLPGGGRCPDGHGEHPGDADGVRGWHGEDVLHEEGVELDDLPEQHHLQDGHEPHPAMLEELL